MEKFVLEKDIPVMYLTADSFPDGIMAAHHTLHAIVTSHDRLFFGISYPDKKGNVIYKAGAEQHSAQEAMTLGLETYTIRKGTYNSILVKDYFKNTSAISEIFQQLLASPDLDPQGACIEMYLGERDLRCMVRLK
ncbi:MAG: putative transcription activator [Chitinophagaceae bacterium]|nr:putative transcription activator [Chitinophagaceae bacterium]